MEDIFKNGSVLSVDVIPANKIEYLNLWEMDINNLWS